MNNFEHHIFVKIKPGALVLQMGKLHKWPECTPPQYEGNSLSVHKTKHPDRVFLASVNKLLKQYVCIADGFGFKGIKEVAVTLDAFVPTTGSFGGGSINVMSKNDIIEVTYADYKKSLEEVKKQS